jgi:hypothetical protein
MRLKGTTADGFKLTDTDSNKEISRAEDSNANMIVSEFSVLDTFAPGTATTTPVKNTPSVEPNQQLDKWELNAKYPMWEVNNLLTTYANTNPNNAARLVNGVAEYMNALEYAES